MIIIPFDLECLEFEVENFYRQYFLLSSILNMMIISPRMRRIRVGKDAGYRTLQCKNIAENQYRIEPPAIIACSHKAFSH